MLICNVSLRPPRRAIAADLLEAGAALDVLGTGNVVFATLVDDPASVGDTVDAYLGEIMLEAASAADFVTVGNVYYADAVEAVTAIDTPDAVLAATPATWNASDIIRATLSNGNLTVTTTGSNNGCVRATGGGKSSGKYYFEYTPNTFSQGNDFAGLASPSIGLPIAINTANTVGIDGLTRVWVGTSTPLGSGGIGGAISTLYFAVDFGALLFWVKPSGGDWNGSPANNPATGVGGVSISTLSLPLVPFAKPVLGGDSATANFGASTFSGIVPSGFTAGWPA